MKFLEAEIQNHIWDNRDNFADFLIEPKRLDEILFDDDLSNVSAKALIKNRIFKKLNKFHSKSYAIELIGCEVPLEQDSNSTIRADFLATFPGDTGIAIIELKKSSQTERQAFTELLAYSNHLSTVFPGMSREDSVYILISPMSTRIARDAVIQSLTFDNRIIIALIPIVENPNDINTLKLKLWIPKDSELATFSNIAFREDNFSVCKIVWKYKEGWWDAPKGENPNSDLIAQHNSVSTLASQYMEEAGIHGFTYCSQVWSELEPSLPFTNSLVLVGLNPYAVGSTQYLAEENNLDKNDLPSPQSYMPNITEIIPGLNKSAESIHSEIHYLEDLHSVWDSQLFRIGKLVVDSLTMTTSGHSSHTEQGFMDWHTYQRQFLEDSACHNFYVRATGLVRHLYLDVMNLDYTVCGKVGVENHPIHGDMPYNAVEFLTSHFYFRAFILRMLGDNEEYS